MRGATLVLGLIGPVLAYGQSRALETALEEFQLASKELGLRADSPAPRNSVAPMWRSWHGRLYENLRNDKLDATPHEVVQRGGERNLLRRNQFGFNAGGPLVIPKLYDGSRRTFLNISYEGVRESIGRSFLRTVAIEPERRGDFSQTVDPAGAPLPIYDPASTQLNPNYNPNLPVSVENLQYARAAFPGNQIPASRLDPIALRAVREYAAPNASAGPFFRNNYFVFSPESNVANGMIFKVDHNVTEKSRVTFNGSFTNGLARAPRLMNTVADPGNNDRTFSARRGVVDWTYTLSGATVNTLTVDAQTDLSRNARPGEERAVEELGLEGPLGLGFPVMRFSNYLWMGRQYPNTRSTHHYYFVTEAFSTRVRQHRLRWFGQWRHFQVNAFLPQRPAGQFEFGPWLTSLPGINNTGHEFASFLLGLPQAASASVVANPSYWRQNQLRVGVSDNYEYSKSLQFSASLVMVLARPRYEKFDRFATVDPRVLNPENGRPGALVFAGRDGNGRALQPAVNRPELSLGVAWNPGGSARNVLRASYGLSYGSIPMYTTQWGTQGHVAQPTLVSPNTQLAPAVVLREGFPALERPLPDLRGEAANFTVADLVDRSGRVPIYQSAGLSLERDLGRQTMVTLSLGHARGQRLFVSNQSANPNAIPLSFLTERDRLNSEAFRREIRPFPQYQRFNLFSSFPAGNYKRHAMVVRLDKRSAAGLATNISYEWSKQLDDYSGPYGIQDFYNLRNEWSLTSSNHPHRLTMNLSYELPIGAKKQFLAFQDWRRYLVDGWMLSSISIVQSGVPLALQPQFNNTGGVIEGLRVDLVPGVNARVEGRNVERWFNPGAFAQPADFTPGNGFRTHPQLLGPGLQNHDLSVSKRFAVTTEKVLEFTATGFNFTNTGIYAEPDMVIGPLSAPNANAGRINETRGGRVIQLGLRLSF